MGSQGALLERLKEHQRVLQQIRGLLPEHLSVHCLAAVINRQIITLYVSGPAWAHQLRFFLDELGEQLQQQTGRECQIRLRNQMIENPKKITKTAPSPASGAVLECLRACCESQEDPHLSASLRRLRETLQQVPKGCGF
jgi:hypothetical protein